MNGTGLLKIFFLAAVILFPVAFRTKRNGQKTGRQKNNPLQLTIKLPDPVFHSGTSIEEALQKRRSVRNYKKEPIELRDISQLLWAAQGITSAEDGRRTAPSAGALYPLEIYVVSANINSVPPGVYHYRPLHHTLEQIAEGDRRTLLMAAALMQGAVKKCAAVIVIACDYRRTTGKYFERGKKYVHMEAGHAAQNVYLQAVSLKLGTVVMGAFSDSLIRQILQLPKTEDPLYLMPVGKM